MSLSDGWRLVTVSDVCERIVGGGTPSTKNRDFWSGETDWISSADIHGLKNITFRNKISSEAIDASTTNVVPEGTVIVVTRVGLGKIAIAPKALCFNQDCQGLILKKGLIIQLYALYVLAHAVQSFKQKGRGTTISGVTKKQLAELEFLLPPLNIQKLVVEKIDELFSELDRTIDLLQTTLKQVAMFKASSLDGLFKDVIKEYPDSEQTIGGAYDVYVGATPSRGAEEYWGGEINWVSSGEVAFKDIHSTKEMITELGLKNTSTTLHPEGTVLLAMIGEGKTRGQAAILKIEAAHNQNTAAIRVDPASGSSEYLYYFLMSEYDKTRAIGSGNNQKALNKSRVQAIPIPYPSLKIQMEVSQKAGLVVSAADRAADEIKQQLIATKALKQSILSKAFKGELV